MRLNFGLVLLSLHKPPTSPSRSRPWMSLSGARHSRRCARYRDGRIIWLRTTQKERVRRFGENLEAIKRL